MCYMAVYPPGVMPEPDHLIEGERLNPHGYGWSVGLDTVHHSLHPCAGAFMIERHERMGEPAIFHARYATGGATSLANCQPLVLDDGTILAHNGGLFDVDGPESDTRVFAEKFLPKWNLDSLDDRRELSGLVYPNKFVIFRPGKAPVALNDQLGIWLADGSWHSNSDFTGQDHKRPGVCAACGTPLVSELPAQLCPSCSTRYALRWNKLVTAR